MKVTDKDFTEEDDKYMTFILKRNEAYHVSNEEIKEFVQEGRKQLELSNKKEEESKPPEQSIQMTAVKNGFLP